MANLSERLRYLKSERHLMQKEIAQSVQIPLRTYQRYENGEREPNASAIIALANYFEVSTDYLLGITDNPNRNT